MTQDVLNRIQNVRVVVIPQGNCFVAQCLEYDIAAQASSFEELKNRIARMLAGHIILAIQNNEEPFANLGPAPDYFKSKWEDFKDNEGGTLVKLDFADKLHAFLTTENVSLNASAELLIA